jgi:diguanylate cyclase
LAGKIDRAIAQVENAEVEFNALRLDPLTQIPNRATLTEQFAQEAARSFRLNQPLSIVLVDADKFKTVNDTYGHTTGDVVLQKLAEMLNENIRVNDTVGRYGGEEFIILMPNTTPQDAAKVVDRIRASLAKIPIQTINGRELMVTFSAGISSAVLKDAQGRPLAPEAAFRQSVESADRLLYQAKEQGRNRVVSSP